MTSTSSTRAFGAGLDDPTDAQPDEGNEMTSTSSTRAFGAGLDEIGRPVIALRLRCPDCNREVRGARLRIAQRLGLRRTCSIGHRRSVTVEPHDIRPDRALHRIEWLPIAA